MRSLIETLGKALRRVGAWRVARRSGVLLAIALLLAVLVRGFVMEPFYIPSRSMERNLLEGDAVLVSKLHYGPRTPRALSVPFTDWRVPGVRVPSFRLPGFAEVERGDVMVFHYPTASGPIGEKPYYVKRAVGLPGEWFSMMDNVPFVDGEPVPPGRKLRSRWVARAQSGATLSADSLRAVGADPAHPILQEAGRVTFEASRSIARKVEAWEEVSNVSAYVANEERRASVFPMGRGFSREDYGPIYVPARGDRIRLTVENWPAYQRIIRVYEEHEATRWEGQFLIDGQPTEHYTFEQDYYFVLGDNRDNSFDSRSWGFVPASHLVGKAVMVYFSWNEAREQPRLDRLFTPVR